MSSEASENELLDVGPVSGSRSVSASVASNARQKLESALSKLDPPRHRLVPVERIDNVRVERSEKVTVERADLDGGGKSETVRIERVETVYDEESDAVRVERSETVRVERVHTSQHSTLPEPDQLSASDAARQMLTEHEGPEVDVEQPGVVNGVPRTIRPDRPPPQSSASTPEPPTSAHDQSSGLGSDPIDVDAYVEGERASERIEIPDRVYGSPDSGHQRTEKPETVSVKEESRPAFFRRFEPTNPPTSKPARNGSEHPESAQNGVGPMGSSNYGDTVDVPGGGNHIPPTSNEDPYNQAPHEQNGDAPPPDAPESTGPVDLEKLANFTQQKHSSTTNSSRTDDAAGASNPGRDGSPAWSRGDDTGEIGRPSLGQADHQPARDVSQKDQPSSKRQIPPSAGGAGPVDRPAAPEARQIPVENGPGQANPDTVTSLDFDPTVSQSQRAFRPPPVLDIPVDTERPSGLEVSAAVVEEEPLASTEQPAEIDPFDDYLEDPLGFFAPSIEMDVIPERLKPQANTRSTRTLRSAGSAREKGVNSSSADRQEDSEYRDGRREIQADRRPGAPRRQNPGERAKAPNPASRRRQPKQLARGPRPGAGSSDRRGRDKPVGSSSGGLQDAPFDEHEDDYRSKEKPFGRKSVRSIADRFKYGSVFVVLFGLVIVGLSARFAFSGANVPEGEILQHQGVSWWADTDSVSRSYIPEDCVANLEALGASKRTAEWAALEAIPREDRSCENIIAPES